MCLLVKGNLLNIFNICANVNIMKRHNNLTIYINYFFAFLFSISFLVAVNYLGLENYEKYILILSISTIFASTIYSSSIKSEIINDIIKIDFTNNSIKILLVIALSICFYLIHRGNYFLVFFFLLTILYEFCYHLFAISFIKRNKTLGHSQFVLATSIFKNLSLLFCIISYNLLNIIIIFYVFYFIVFIFNYKKININLVSNSKPLNIFDLFYVLIGSLIFQLDKIIGENLLSKNNYITYFLIFKFASSFQILGSLLTQPIRNKMISTERVSSENEKKLSKIIFILFSLLIISNFFLFIAAKIDFFNLYIFKINFVNLMVFNFLAMSIIIHIYNSLYIDALFINGYSKTLIYIYLPILILILISLLLFQSLLIWSLIIFISQILLLILSFIKYKKYVQ